MPRGLRAASDHRARRGLPADRPPACPPRPSPRGDLALPVMAIDRYGSDVLNTDWRAPKRGRAVEIEADKGLVVEEVTTDWCGEIVACERDLQTVTLEDRRGKRRDRKST